MKSTSQHNSVASTPILDAQEYDLTFDIDSWIRFIEFESERIKQRESGESDRPMGLRLSTECPVRRVREFLDDRYRLNLAPGIAERGHEMENRIRAIMPHLFTYYQQTITWSAGSSAFDGFSRDGRPVEVKSAVGKRTPSTANKRQADRMLTAYGCSVGTQIEFWMVDPAKLVAIGPTIHTLTAERKTQVEIELAACTEAYKTITNPDDDQLNTAEYWHQQYGLICNCGACINHDNTVDADHPLEQIATAYDLAKHGQKQAETLVEARREQIIMAAKIKLQTIPNAKHIKTYWPPLTITQRKDGNWMIRTRNESSL